MKITKREEHLPPLYSRTADGATQIWKVWAENGVVYTEYGRVGGKMQTTVGRRSRTTNEGRANERGNTEQAQAEAESMWKHRLERTYRLKPEDLGAPILLPMLAHGFWQLEKGSNEKKLTNAAKKLTYPVFVQRKLNGARCIARWVDGKIVLFSRQGKIWNVPHIADEARELLSTERGMALDGELYIHGWALQKLMSLAKDYREESKSLEYHVYDMIDVERCQLTQRERLKHLGMIYDRENAESIIRVETLTITSPDQIAQFEQKFVEEGYEGAIVRGEDATYRWNYRSPSLLKYKSFEDAEFEVVDCVEGVGKFEGCAIFVCKNDVNDLTFRVSPKVNMVEKRKLWENRKTYFGRKYTVRFYERTEDEKPFHPVGIAFRVEEDLP